MREPCLRACGAMGSCGGAVRAARRRPRPRRPRRPRRGQRRDPGGRDRDRRPLGRRQVDAAAAAEPARRPRPRRDRLPRPAARATTTRWRCGARSPWSRSCRRCWRGRSSRTSRYAADLAGEELDAGATPAPRRPRPRLRRARRRQALGRRAAAGDAGAGAGPAARASSCSTSRPRPSTTPPATRSRRRWRELRRELGDLDRPRQPRPRAGAPPRRLGGAARGGPRRRLRRARGGAGVIAGGLSTSIHVVALAGRRLAGPGRAGGGDLLLAAGRPRARHRRRHRPLVRPADPGRLRDQADLRGRHDLAGASCCWR